MGRACGTERRERRVAYGILVGRYERRRPLGTPTFRWDDNIKTDIEGIACRTWTGFIWLKLRSSSGLLWTQRRTFGLIGYRIFTMPQFVLLNVTPFTFFSSSLFIFSSHNLTFTSVFASRCSSLSFTTHYVYSSSLCIVSTPSNTCDAINWHRSNSLCICNKRPFGRKQNCFSVMRSDWYIDSWFRNWQRKVKTWSSGGLWCLVQIELPTLMLFREHSLPSALSCAAQHCTEPTAERKMELPWSCPSPLAPRHPPMRAAE